MADDVDVLDDPVGQSLSTRHAHLARRVGAASSYLPEVATFAAVPRRPTSSAWADLALLLGPGELADLFSADLTPPDGWAPVFSVDGVQMVAGQEGVRGIPEVDECVVRLGADDVPDMLRLVDLTRPGPFRPRTVELGSYVGIREAGELVARGSDSDRPDGRRSAPSAPHPVPVDGVTPRSSSVP